MYCNAIADCILCVWQKKENQGKIGHKFMEKLQHLMGGDVFGVNMRQQTHIQHLKKKF
jgi:hypothetical protein